MDPTWDPRGEVLAVVENPSGDRTTGTARVSLLELRTGKKTVLLKEALNVSWSPGGDYLAVGCQGARVVVLTTSGNQVTALVATGRQYPGRPNGSRGLLVGGYGTEQRAALLSRIMEPFSWSQRLFFRGGKHCPL